MNAGTEDDMGMEFLKTKQKDPQCLNEINLSMDFKMAVYKSDMEYNNIIIKLYKNKLEEWLG